MKAQYNKIIKKYFSKSSILMIKLKGKLKSLDYLILDLIFPMQFFCQILELLILKINVVWCYKSTSISFVCAY